MGSRVREAIIRSIGTSNGVAVVGLALCAGSLPACGDDGPASVSGSASGTDTGGLDTTGSASTTRASDTDASASASATDGSDTDGSASASATDTGESATDMSTSGTGDDDTTDTGDTTSATEGGESTGGGVCTPGATQCSGDDVEVCNEAGDGWQLQETCDGTLGFFCHIGTGGCEELCAPENIGPSYIGCEYYPTVTSNPVDTAFNFSVAVANTSAQQAIVTVTRGGVQVAQVNVPADEIEIINLPWVEPLKGGQALDVTWPTVLAEEGAYRLQSTRPVTVYQYSPIEYEGAGTCPFDCSYTNDASLLLPTNAWGNEYVVTSRNTLGTQVPGFYAITAMEDQTTVTLMPSATGAPVAPGAGVPADGAAQVTLDEGDVLQVYAALQASVDLTGTRIESDKPIQVIGGHRCTYVPDDTPYCDHLEESMFPVDALAHDYIVTTPLIHIAGNDVDSPNMVRIIATEPQTTITYDPPQAGAPDFLAAAGDFAEIAATSANFQISADKKIQVAQYMRGQEATNSEVGDPAMAMAVPTEQFRNVYLFHAPTNYAYNYVNIVAPTNATVMLDGVAVAGWSPIGNTGFSFARVPLDNAGNGNHTATSMVGFGISVYGYGVDTSYWYPGGSDLSVIPQ
jgi:hypothetical protein